MRSTRKAFGVALFALLATDSSVEAQVARVTEEVRTLTTYPFSDPSPVPFLTRDERLYPYHSFEGYAHDPVEREWKVVRLENDYIEVYVLPEVGGKVWGAVVKETGHEFIYRNEVVKFRNIALRGPWTSGGIEFNFGVIGHTPATATPVDYATRHNPDGSASVFVGTMDLPSRTSWRVEIRLPPDRAYFETNVVWHNPTPLEQPYYNWMTAAAFARDDLVMTVPGNAYLEHPGGRRAWPVDEAGRHLPTYAENRFGPSKSYHVVGEMEDFFGGYYVDAGYGFGHWSRYEEMPGQKIWLWALSRQGGIWEDLLTDTDGQYIEFQAGRLFVQYAPGADVNPISQVGFDPGATDRWTETWFPVEGLGGLTDASREGAMFVERANGRVTVRLHAFGPATDTLRVFADGRLVAEEPLRLDPLEPVERVVDVPDATELTVEAPSLGLRHESDPEARTLSRPFATDARAPGGIPEADRLVTAARQLLRGGEPARARVLYERALDSEPWNRDALLGLADVEYRRGRYEAGLVHADRLLQLDAYDPDANFAAGNLYRGLGRDVDAAEAFGWAARSMAFRTASYVQLAELALRRGSPSEAARYAHLAVDYDRHNLAALEIAVIAARRLGDAAEAERLRERILEIDPLRHFVPADRFVASPDPAVGRTFLDGLRSEYPDQEILELAIAYARRGGVDDAVALLGLGAERVANPLLIAWRAWLTDDPGALPPEADPAFVFPYRPESVAVLEWAARGRADWSWRYLLALGLWGTERADEAARVLAGLGDEPDYAPAYVTRAHLAPTGPGDAERDLRRAVELAPGDRLVHRHLVRHLQDADRWSEALSASSAARALLPSDFDLDLLHVRSLVELGQAGDALEILDGIRVLPSENSGTSHALWVQANLLAALDALEAGDAAEAARLAGAARTWPERLGQGRPYDPEERLATFVLGLATGRSQAFEAVLDASSTPAEGRLDLLAIPALLALDRNSELGLVAPEGEEPHAAFARGLVAAVRSGEPVADAAARLAPTTRGLFDDAEGRILLEALTSRASGR